MKILFVCLGNICRSPLAHGIMDDMVQKHGLDWEVDSAGTGSWHIGELPDHRSQAVAMENGIDLSYQRARQFTSSDFDKFDIIYCMDQSNLNHILAMSDNENHASKIKLIMNELSDENKPVEDPYYNNRFSEVFAQLHKACQAIIEKYG